MKNLKLKNALLIALATSISLGFTSCGKKSECDIPKYHLHKYEKEGMIKYLDTEELTYKGFRWTDDVVYVSSKEKDIKQIEKKKGLLKIQENENYLKEKQEKNQDFIEYRYAYTYLQPIPHFVRTGKVTRVYFTYIPVTHYSWTKDPNHSRLTGEKRLCHYVYTACKIEKNAKGKYVVVKSPQVDDIFSIQEEYPYFTEKYTKIVGTTDGLELDYEQGATDEQENVLSDEDAQEYEEGKEYTKRK